jgi:DNA-binding MarR family transcriptional regulator
LVSHYDDGVTDSVWLSDREQRAWRTFLEMQGTLRARIAQQLQRECGLSASDYEVLVNLSESPAGRMRAYELGQATRWEKSRISHHLTRMAKRGLVRRQARTGDPRYADVVLTDAGRAAIENAAPRHVAHVRTWFIEAMSPAELEVFAAACDAILKRLEACPP